MDTGERFEALDAARGICAVVVVIFHFIHVMDSAAAEISFFRNGYLFVDFFFVLSGFVLCHSYRGRIASVDDFRRFVIKRFGRVWPLHAVVLAGFILTIVTIGFLPHPAELSLTWHDGSYTIDSIVPSALLLTAVGLQGSVWNGPAWSIGAEYYTYLMFAVVLMLSARRLFAISLGLSAAALAFIYWKAPTLMNATWDYGFIRCIAGFFAGVVAYHFHGLGRPWRLWRATVLEATMVAAVILFVGLAGEDADNVSALSLAAPVVFGAAVLVFARQQGLLSLVLLARPFRALGRYSYSIYMIHMPMLIMLCYGAWHAGYRTMAFGGGDALTRIASVDLLMVDYVLAVIVLAAAGHHFIEKPARAWFGRLADRGQESARGARAMARA